MKCKNTKKYNEKSGNIVTLLVHRKGKSSSSTKSTTIHTSTSCKNRFQIFSDIELSGSYMDHCNKNVNHSKHKTRNAAGKRGKNHGNGQDVHQNIKDKVYVNTKVNEALGKKDNVRQKKCLIKHSLEDRVDNHDTVLEQSCSVDNNKQVHIDDTETNDTFLDRNIENQTFSKDSLNSDLLGECVDYDNKPLYSKDIVRATHEGSTLVKKINVYDIRDKCKDLSKAIIQQQGVYGFLPINDLLPLPTDVTLGPKKILTWQDFDPIKLHKQVFASGTYNFRSE